MYYVIEYNTDMRHPDPKYHRFTNSHRAKVFQKAYKTRFAFPGAAINSLPVTQQNFHHRLLSSTYEMPKGFCLTREARKLRRKEEYHGHSTYPEHYKTNAIYKFGKRVPE
jgi:hypothetical protein